MAIQATNSITVIIASIQQDVEREEELQGEKESKREATSSESPHASWEKFAADIGGHQAPSASSQAPSASTQPSPPSANYDTQIENALAALDASPGDPKALQDLYTVIGGQANLSSWRAPDGSSLLDLTGYSVQPNGATALLNAGFQYKSVSPDGTIVQNDLSPRYQWDENDGYCGENSFITAALNNGAYLSQAEMRALNGTQVATGNNSGELLLGGNDGNSPDNVANTAAQLHLNAEEYVYDPTSEVPSAQQFLTWVKGQVLQGNPVVIGVYTNESIFGDKADEQADYDHIVTVTGIGSNYPSSDTSYHGDDTIYYSDNGLYGDSKATTQYQYSATFDGFQASRSQADAKGGPVYSLSNGSNGSQNYGVAISGIKDADKKTLPVHILTNVNDEDPEIKDGKNTLPAPTSTTLSVCVTGLTPGVTYNVYKYDSLDSIPDGAFNANGAQAASCTPITVSTGSSYVFTQDVTSDQTVAYRVVPVDAP